MPLSLKIFSIIVRHYELLWQTEKRLAIRLLPIWGLQGMALMLPARLSLIADLFTPITLVPLVIVLFSTMHISGIFVLGKLSVAHNCSFDFGRSWDISCLSLPLLSDLSSYLQVESER